MFCFLLFSSAQDSAFLNTISTHAVIQAHAAMYRKTSQILKPLIFNSYKLEILINCILKLDLSSPKNRDFFFLCLTKETLLYYIEEKHDISMMTSCYLTDYNF